MNPSGCDIISDACRVSIHSRKFGRSAFRRPQDKGAPQQSDQAWEAACASRAWSHCRVLHAKWHKLALEVESNTASMPTSTYLRRHLPSSGKKCESTMTKISGHRNLAAYIVCRFARFPSLPELVYPFYEKTRCKVRVQISPSCLSTHTLIPSLQNADRSSFVSRPWILFTYSQMHITRAI